jgi:hypothetical protein
VVAKGSKFFVLSFVFVLLGGLVKNGWTYELPSPLMRTTLWWEEGDYASGGTHKTSQRMEGGLMSFAHKPFPLRALQYLSCASLSLLYI